MKVSLSNKDRVLRSPYICVCRFGISLSKNYSLSGQHMDVTKMKLYDGV